MRTSCSRWSSGSRPRAARRTRSAVDARKEEEVVALVERIERDIGADRGRGVQHRRQRPLPASSRRRRACTSRSGRWRCFAGFLMGARGRQGAWWRAGPRHDPLHRRDGEPARLGRASPRSPAPSTRCARSRRAWRASSGRSGIHVAHVVIDGAIDTAVHPRELPGALCAEGRSDGILDPDAHRRDLLAGCTAAARRLDARARPAAVDRKILNHPRSAFGDAPSGFALPLSRRHHQRPGKAGSAVVPELEPHG